MRTNAVSALEGDTFVVSDRRGDIAISPEEAQGLFQGDTRFLSRWVLTVNGKLPNPLSTDDVHYFVSQFFLVPGTGTIYVDSPLSIVRQRAVGGGFHEDFKIQNHTDKPQDLDIRIEEAADFADLFQVKEVEFKRRGQFYKRIDSNRLVLGYGRDRFFARPGSLRVPPPRLTRKRGILCPNRT